MSEATLVISGMKVGSAQLQKFPFRFALSLPAKLKKISYDESI